MVKKKSILRLPQAIKKSTYIFFYNKKSIKSNAILMESENGKGLADNIFYILNELAKPEYCNYKIYIAVLSENMKLIKDKLELYNLGNKKNISLIKSGSFKYNYCLATSKYLFTDTSFPRNYIKKDGQIIVNTWHGTPLKKMGRDVKREAYRIGNVQRNILASDYFICPNIYKKDKMFDAFMLDELYDGTILYEGYPRNSVFFNQKVGERIKKDLNLDNKEIFIYMPTWRDEFVNMKSDYFLSETERYLNELDKKLKKNQICYVKMHTFVSNTIDYSRYNHIYPLPERYNTYEFLNICKVLITDYSSVLFDFANSRKKIILFVYDESQYLNERGLYISLDQLPFPIVKTVDNLVHELNSPKQYDDSNFINDYCTYDSPEASERICRHVVKGDKVCREEKISKNGKDNVLIYSGNLAKNGVTVSLLNLLKNIDLGKRNIYITFREKSLRTKPLRVEKIPEKANIFPISSGLNLTIKERIVYKLFFRFNIDNILIRKSLDCLYRREIKKLFSGVCFNYLIHFNGYESNIINLFQRFKGKRIIYVHSDMVKEIKTKKKQHLLTLKNAYQNYDKVAVVTEDIVPPTIKISGQESNVVVVNNCHDYNTVLDKARQPIMFDHDTQSNVSLDVLQVLMHESSIKFITIGRFSTEKNHLALMKAFEKFNTKYPKSILIIIGGYGKLYIETINYANNSKADIIIIKSLNNPMPILARSNLFILSSLYEGLALVVLEADTLGIPVISTNIPGLRGFMKKHGGYLVEPNEAGILNGMLDYINGNIRSMDVNYDNYNKNAIGQFERLFI